MSTAEVHSPPQTPGLTRTPKKRSFFANIPPGTVALYIGVILFLLITVIPIYWIVLSAFTPITELFTTPLNYIPVHPSFINFQTVAQIVPLDQQFINNTLLSVLSAAFSVLVSLLAAYAFARISFPGSNILFLGLLISGYLPTISIIIPLFQMFENLSLLDSIQGLVILLVSFLMPTSVWIMTSFVRQIPVELEEAGQIDGANFLSIFWHVIIPVLRPSIATLFLINLVASWQEFFFPLIFSRSDASATLTLGITQAAVNPQYQTVAWGNEAAMGLIVIAPIFIITIVFQKQIVEGLMAGSLKG
ncbi:carbohydrate ABC transporter permease [Dictyobacter arantiisoli]|uniref:ABC transporter permease n=1 Tax=Dictyobacter arantiisoli TaxID=2014874 RepID=A0A5A5TG98_9CHLR|nr:carbohydrate ABC transporter permease [Dictyobacter arantiisoli]GCF10601.1 ABC transporter permease [Dictyobacter arantiisoli]